MQRRLALGLCPVEPIVTTRNLPCTVSYKRKPAERQPSTLYLVSASATRR